MVAQTASEGVRRGPSAQQRGDESQVIVTTGEGKVRRRLYVTPLRGGGEIGSVQRFYIEVLYARAATSTGRRLGLALAVLLELVHLDRVAASQRISILLALPALKKELTCGTRGRPRCSATSSTTCPAHSQSRLAPSGHRSCRTTACCRRRRGTTRSCRRRRGR